MESWGDSERQLTLPSAASHPRCFPTNENKPPRSLGNFSVTGQEGGTLFLRLHYGGSEDHQDEFSRSPSVDSPHCTCKLVAAIQEGLIIWMHEKRVRY